MHDCPVKHLREGVLRDDPTKPRTLPAQKPEVMVTCTGCSWGGRFDQANQRNGCASCPVCTRFVYVTGATI